MRKILLASAASIVLSGAAIAADLPGRAPALAPAPVFVAMNWTGFYIGAHVGAMNGRDRWTFNGVAGPWAPAGASAALSNTGFTGGLQAGYMHQFGSLVAGLDLSGSIGGSRRSVSSPFFPATDRFSSQQNWLGLAQLRLGFAADRFMLFMQGGAAFTDHRIALTSTVLNPERSSSTRTGWTLGAGVNYKLTPNWILGAQYNYVDFGGRTHDLGSNAPAGDALRTRKTDHVFKVTLDYQFVMGGFAPVVAKF